MFSARSVVAACTLFAASGVGAASIAYDFTAMRDTDPGVVMGRIFYDPEKLIVKNDFVQKVFYEGDADAMRLSFSVNGGAYDGISETYYPASVLAVEDRDGSGDNFSITGTDTTWMFLGDSTWSVFDDTDVPTALALEDFDHPIFYLDTNDFGFSDGQVRYTVTSLTRTDADDPFAPAPVPLPAGFPLIVAGLAALGLIRRRA